MTSCIWTGRRSTISRQARRREPATAFRYRFLNRVPSMSGPQAALAYVLRHPKISTAIFGTTQLAHLEQNLAAALALAADVAARIERSSDARARAELLPAISVHPVRGELRGHSTVDTAVQTGERAYGARGNLSSALIHRAKARRYSGLAQPTVDF